MDSRLIRPYNLFLSVYSYLSSNVSRGVIVKGMPVAIGIELTNHCNLSCTECMSASGAMTRSRGFMDKVVFKKVIKELGPYLYNMNLYFQGEPMLHPQFFEFMSYSAGINTTVSTNGHFLTKENSEKIALSGLTKLIISLDGMDQETYALYRTNGNFATVVKGIEETGMAIKRNRSALQLEIQFLVNRRNEHQIHLVKSLAGRVGASLKLKSMQIINRENYDLWLPRKKRFNRYKLVDGEYVIKNSLPDRCARLWFNPVITWDGRVVPCCFDKNGDYIMGDLNNDSFRDIWEGSKYKLFRKSILNGRHLNEICRNCTSGSLRIKS